MGLDDFIVAVYCLIDDALLSLSLRVRRSGPPTKLSDAEVLTMEAVGEFLGMAQDKQMVDFFRCHYPHFFPALKQLDRTTFIRQAANLWRLKERLWQHMVGQSRHDPALAFIDSMALPVCHFGRAKRCRLFRPEAAYGRDHLLKIGFFGFRVHLRVCHPGVITAVALLPANVAETEAAPWLADGTGGLLLGDRGYWSPLLKEELAAMQVRLVAPFRLKSKDPRPKSTLLLNRWRRRIETTIGQLVERFHLKSVWARDLWHLSSRLLRKVLSHTIAFRLNQILGNPAPLRFEALLQ